MKSKFNTIDLVAVISELKDVVGMRLSQVYDIDHKTYLFKLGRQEEKCTLLVESGIRIHKTDYEWPKNPAPHGFTMKLRKHLKNKRLEKINQLGIDRVVDMQFGINEATYHVIVELYDRGNIVLTDSDYMILNILRPRASENEDVRFVVREKYPKELARQAQPSINDEKLQDILKTAKVSDSLKKILNPHFIYGPTLIEHILLNAGFAPNCKIGKEFDLSMDLPKLQLAIEKGEEIMKSVAESQNLGYIIHKTEKLQDSIKDERENVSTFVEFHPVLFLQHKNNSYKEFPSFNKAVDYFFSNLESQKIDVKTFQKEREAMKKLENIRKDHESRINTLQKVQTADQIKAQFIEMNLQLVDNALLVIRHAIANQLGWTDIWNLVQEAQKQGDPTAKAISSLKLDTNHFTMLLHDPYTINEADNDEMDNHELKVCKVDIDLDLSAYANARKYYDQKRQAAKKEQKTIESSTKAYKSAEKKAKQTLKEVAITSTIIKARKTFWFEKFLWFISSENYIVIAGRDVQQNELIVKRYMKSGDIYVHADLHGASSIVIKNPSGNPVPPKTLNEAGTMAVCYSTAWDAKVITSAWWVYHHQVSKTAPTGEYLVAGSFMIRGKKNYLLPSYLIVGFGFLFKLDEDSIERHSEERKVKGDEDQNQLVFETELNENHLSSEKGSDDESDSSTEVKEIEPSNEGTDTNNCTKSTTAAQENETIELSESSEEEEVSHFPDTTIKVPNFQMESTKDNFCDGVVYLGDDKPIILSARDCKENITKTLKSQRTTDTSIKEGEKHEQLQQQKRGHKSKLKKIKEKYKNQDEEERELRMKILASAGNKSNVDGKGKKDKKSKVVREKQNQKSKKQLQDLRKNLATDEAVIGIVTDSPLVSNLQQSLHKVENVVEQVEKSDDEANDDVMRQNEDEAILSSLTGCPHQEDTLMFAVPVCAPYSAMQSYKFKVKIIPGTGKRGKASKTALNIFLNDKSITSREKDLLRSTKEQDICRNIPGKVKLSVPGINKRK